MYWDEMELKKILGCVFHSQIIGYSVYIKSRSAHTGALWACADLHELYIVPVTLPLTAVQHCYHYERCE